MATAITHMSNPEDTLQEKVFIPEELGVKAPHEKIGLYIPASLDPDYISDEEAVNRAKVIYNGMCICFVILFCAFFSLSDYLEQENHMAAHDRAAKGFTTFEKAKEELKQHQQQAKKARLLSLALAP